MKNGIIIFAIIISNSISAQRDLLSDFKTKNLTEFIKDKQLTEFSVGHYSVSKMIEIDFDLAKSTFSNDNVIWSANNNDDCLSNDFDCIIGLYRSKFYLCRTIIASDSLKSLLIYEKHSENIESVSSETECLYWITLDVNDSLTYSFLLGKEYNTSDGLSTIRRSLTTKIIKDKLYQIDNTDYLSHVCDWNDRKECAYMISNKFIYVKDYINLLYCK
jgi:hypothetical protein